METKVCNCCKEEKPVSEFFVRNNANGYRYTCKECHHKKTKEYEESKGDKYKLLRKEHYEKNKDRYKMYSYYNKCKNSNDPEKVKIYTDWKAQREIEKQEKRKESIKKGAANHKKWIEDNREKTRIPYNKRRVEKKKESPMTNLQCNLRARTSFIFKNMGFVKEKTCVKILGASWDIVKSHIERQFKEGMCWENYGMWHIDHSLPLTSATTEEELINLCHYRNLQPLWAKENLQKHNKIVVGNNQTFLPI